MPLIIPVPEEQISADGLRPVRDDWDYDPLPAPIPLSTQQWPSDTRPLVTVRCITFNHAAFIRQAIDGFLDQRTNFPVEILIHDDASTDGTADIVREYAERYPNLIIAVLQPENLFSQGKWSDLDGVMRGRYEAHCEGDDYWVVADKLQRQIELFQQDPQCVLVGARAYLWADGDPAPFAIQPDLPPEAAARLGPADFFVNGPWMHTATRVWLTDFQKQLRRDIPDRRATPDLGQVLYTAAAARQGRVSIRFLDAVTSVYRKHPGGIWTGRSVCPTLDWELHISVTLRRFFSPRDQRRIIDPIIAGKLVEIIKRCPKRSFMDRLVIFSRFFRYPMVIPYTLMRGVGSLLKGSG